MSDPARESRQRTLGPKEVKIGCWRAALTLGLLALPATHLAQTTGAIDGTIVDIAGFQIAGAVIEISGPSLQGTRKATSGPGGFYRIPAAPPGDYRVTATLAGSRTAQKTTTVRLGATSTVDFVLELATAEEVNVSGAAPLIDRASTTAGTSYTSENIRQLPVDRNYADVALANPGTGTDFGYTDGRFLPLTIYGATSSENQWTIDGINTTDVRYGTQGKAMSSEFVQELEVKTGGYSAEYGRATGGIINVVTKSGGNTYHGDAFAYYDSADTMAARRFDPMDQVVMATEVDDGTSLDYGASLGGFLLKDRIWFFGSYDRATLDAHVSRVVPSRDVPADYLFPLDAEANLYSGKVTWNVAPSTTIVGSVFGDPNSNSGLAGADPRRGFNDLQPQAPLNTDSSTWYSTRQQGGTDFGLRMSQLFGPDVIASLQGSRHQRRSSLTAADEARVTDLTCDGGTPEAPCRRPFPPNSVTGGFGYIVGGNNAVTTRGQLSASATFYRGAHEFSAGGDYMDGRETLTGSFTGGQLVTRWNLYGQTFYQHHFFARSADDLTPLASFVTDTSVIDYSAYVQDSWKAGSNLTINIGLRWDGEQVRDYRGVAPFGTNNQWQPRLGVVWDPWRNGATKVYASAGRFSYAMGTSLSSSLFYDGAFVDTFNFDPTSTVQDPSVINRRDPVVSNLALGVAVDEGLKFPSQDELLVGIERAILPGLTVGLQGTYRRLNNAVGIRADLDYSSPLTGFRSYAVINPGSSEKYASGDVPTCNGLDEPYFQCSPTGSAIPEASRIYRGIELLARETIGNDLWIQASYVYSSLRGNIEGGGGGGSTSNFYYPVAPDFPLLWHNAYGILPFDRPNRFRLDGYWVTPWKVSVGLQLFAESGAPIDKLGVVGFNVGMGYLEPRGSAGRLPTLWEGNVQLSYPIILGPVIATLQASLFNMFNNQIPIAIDNVWAWDLPAGYPDTIFDPDRPQTNETYGTVLARSAPRLFRAALRLSF
jgi:hypothetical protein